MEFYTYVNIFETKGLEYLLLLSFFALFIYLVRYLSGPGKEAPVPEERRATAGGPKAGRPRAANRKRG
jgi:hypothetical protein